MTPFQPSPQLDQAYDVSDYCGVDPLFGTIEQFERLRQPAAPNTGAAVGLTPRTDADCRVRRGDGLVVRGVGPTPDIRQMRSSLTTYQEW
jgi:hypothetical protein